MTKEQLFHKLKDKGLWWSYAKEISYTEVGDDLLLEQLMKYGDYADLLAAKRIFGEQKMKEIWQQRMVYDSRFVRVNLLLARVIFGMDVESDYFKKYQGSRCERIQLSVPQD